MKYLKEKTLDPPSELPPISLGVWISIKSSFIKNSLNNIHTADYTLKIAYLAGVLKSKILLSNLVFMVTLGASSLFYFSSVFYSSSSSISLPTTFLAASSNLKGNTFLALVTTCKDLTFNSTPF